MFSYSFRARDNMKVSGSSTRFGQMKGVSDGKQVSGTPLLAVTATNDGLDVRFSNDGAGYIKGIKEPLSWEDATGEWVHVQIKTTFGQSMEVCIGDRCLLLVEHFLLCHMNTTSASFGFESRFGDVNLNFPDPPV